MCVKERETERENRGRPEGESSVQLQQKLQIMCGLCRHACHTWSRWWIFFFFFPVQNSLCTYLIQVILLCSSCSPRLWLAAHTSPVLICRTPLGTSRRFVPTNCADQGHFPAQKLLCQFIGGEKNFTGDCVPLEPLHHLQDNPLSLVHLRGTASTFPRLHLHFTGIKCHRWPRFLCHTLSVCWVCTGGTHSGL